MKRVIGSTSSDAFLLFVDDEDVATLPNLFRM